MSKSGFAYTLSQIVWIVASAESGEVIGRAEYTYAENSYLVRYCARDGRATEQWWTESALRPFEGAASAEAA